MSGDIIQQVQNVGQLVNGTLGHLLGPFGAAPAAPWFAQLQRASFRGVPFAVLTGEARFGRRVAVHEYPYRDIPWVEDLGRSTRRINMAGFLVENSSIYGGGAVLNQRARMVDAAELAGPAILVHPTLGRLTVSLAEGGFQCVERWDAGRYFEISFTFIESGQKLFPSITVSTGNAILAAAAAADVAAKGDFVSSALGALKQGAAVVSMAISTAGTWGRFAERLISNATNAKNLLGMLPGNLGRFAAIGAAGLAGPLSAGVSLGGIGSLASGVSSAVTGALSGVGLPSIDMSQIAGLARSAASQIDITSVVPSILAQGAQVRSNMGAAIGVLNANVAGLSL